MRVQAAGESEDTWIKGIKDRWTDSGCVEEPLPERVEPGSWEEIRWMEAKLCCVVQPLRGGPPHNFPSDGGDVC